MATDPTSIAETAKRLRALLLDARLDVKEFAASIKAERSAVSNWVNGYYRPPIDKGIKIAREMNVTLEWLYRGIPDHLPMANGIRLTALVQQLSDEALSNDPAPPAAAQEAKPAPRRKKAKAT